MRALLRRYTHLTVQQKRLYSALTVITTVALLMYCLGIGSLVLRSRLVTKTALELPPTFTATPTATPTSAAPIQSTSTPTATLPPTPTQRPIPTYTPTPESVNVTVVVTSTEGVTSTVVISATVTPTATFTPTITTTAQASLTLTALEIVALPIRGSTTPPVNESGSYAQFSPPPSRPARHNTLYWSWTMGSSAFLTDACVSQPMVCESAALSLSHG
jgi:hypothetical protein